MNLTERAAGGLLALACGDALANGVEFHPRGSYHISGMHSDGRFLPAGQWSDDTGLALCLADSLISEQGFNAHDQMQRYIDFYFQGRYWPLDVRLRPGNTLNQAFSRYQKDPSQPYAGSDHPLAAGNGGLMRLLPAILASHNQPQQCRQWAIDATRVTHGAAECLQASELLALIIRQLLQGADRDTALQAGAGHTWTSSKIAALANGDYRHKPLAAIQAKAYVVDTLEAALWCFANTNNLSDALLAAANLGDDCDTAAAVTGQLAGCCYGASAIPEQWLTVLSERKRIEQLAAGLLQLADTTAASGNTGAGHE